MQLTKAYDSTRPTASMPLTSGLRFSLSLSAASVRDRTPPSHGVGLRQNLTIESIETLRSFCDTHCTLSERC